MTNSRGDADSESQERDTKDAQAPGGLGRTDDLSAQRASEASSVAEGDVIPDELIEIVRDVDDPEKVRSVLEMMMVAWSWQGPLPHPKALAAFNEAYDGCAREIVEMTQSQSKHRQALETKVTDADIKLRQRGQYCGFVIAMTAIIGGLVLAGLGRSVTGFGTILLGLGGVVGLFLYSRHRQDTELAAKRDALESSAQPEPNAPEDGAQAQE